MEDPNANPNSDRFRGGDHTAASAADEDTASSTPYHSAPSSSLRPSGGFFYFSAPTSPMHYLCSADSSSSPPLPPPPSSSDFEFSPRLPGPSSSADELFLNGQIRPLLRTGSVHRGARSASPAWDWSDAPAPVAPTEVPTPSGKGSRRWTSLKDLLLLRRSKSEGNANPKDRFWLRSPSGEKQKGRSEAVAPSTTRGDGCGGRKQEREWHHYAGERRRREEMRRRTFLPYRAGLLGCLGLRGSRGYGACLGFPDTWNAPANIRSG